MRIAQCWDDGVVDDIRLIEILRRFGTKASFNLNFGLHEERRSTSWKYLGTKEVWRLAQSELRGVYDGFLVANHCYRHAPLGRVSADIAEQEVREGRDSLEQHFGYPVTGFAYPGGSYNPAAEELVRAAGHVYARTIHMVDRVFPPDNPMAFHPNCDFKDPRFWEKFERARQADDVFYFMGHSYEILTESGWQAFEDQIARLADEGGTWVALPDLFKEPQHARLVTESRTPHYQSMNLTTADNGTNAGTPAWKIFRPAGGETTSRLSGSTKALAARYLSGEIGRSMTEDSLHLSMPGYHTFCEWECDWTLAGPLMNNSGSPDGLAAEDLLLDGAQTMKQVRLSANVLTECYHSVRGKIPFKELFGSAKVHSAAYCFTEIDTASACILTLVLDSDWYCSIFVNGELKHTGAGLSKILRLPLKAGRNLIGFRITGGTHGWRVVLAKGEFLPLEEKCREPDQVELYAEAVKLIAWNAPLRIIGGEKLVGAATLKKAMVHSVPALCCSSVSHTTLGFEKALAVGYKGIRTEIEERLSRGGLDECGNTLLHAMLSCLNSAKIWHGRYLDELKELSGAGNDELAGIIESLNNVPENPPETFREAVQSLWMLWNFQRLCGNMVAIGRIDKMLGQYLKRDLASGMISIDEARELIAHFWIKGCEWITANAGSDNGDAQFYQNIVLGGVDEAGNDVTNEVTYLVLDVVEELHISDFPIAVRISKNSDEMLLRRIAEIQRLGGGIIAVYNDDRIIPNLVNFGYPLADARDFANDGCWEILIPGKTCFGYLPFDALKVLQDVLGLDASDADLSQYTCFDELFEGFNIKLNSQIVQMTNRAVAALKINVTPTVLVDMLIDGCIEKGRSYYHLGPKYTAESPHAGGLPDVANSLQVIKKLVYEDQELSLAELADILRNNWEGHDETRRKICSRFDFYGNDSEDSNAMIQKVFDTYTGLVAGIPSNNGVLFPAGISTFGREASAFLPGRTASAAGSKKGDILALNFSPSPGTDKSGPTAVIKSHCAVDFSRLPGGTALELKIVPSSLQGKSGIAALVGLMKTFVDLGGIFMQIDAMDTAMLRDAQKHPDKYPNLSVRISGWSARFATLSKNWQEMVIVRTEQRV